ncbi:MAG: hypothetical protein R3F55_16270 [Alphaproteobacteria bacterium]
MPPSLPRLAPLFALPILAAFIGPALAEPTTPRPPGGNLGTCYVAPNSDFGCEGAICWCCHTDGCFICNQDFGECEWDPGHAVQAENPVRVAPTLQQLQQYQLTTTPQRRTGQPTANGPATR